MGKCIHHDPIAAGMFNVGFGCGAPNMAQWEGELIMTEEALKLVVERMIHDFEELKPSMRKAFGQKDVATLPHWLVTESRVL